VAGQNTLTFNDENFEQEVLKSNIPVLVDFWAQWCGPCLALAPTIDELANEYAGKVKVGKLDIDASPQIAGKYRVGSIPTVMVFQNGQAGPPIVGARNKRDYKALLDAKLGVA
jgi:thioredoxin 1